MNVLCDFCEEMVDLTASQIIRSYTTGRKLITVAGRAHYVQFGPAVPVEDDVITPEEEIQQ